MYVLDTDMLSLAQHGHAAVGRRIFAYPPTEVCITVITIEEQLSGWYTELRRNRRPEKLAQIYQRITDAVCFLSQLHIVSFPQEAIARYETLRKLNLNVGRMDLRIAAIALELDACVVTRNFRDFQRIPGLQIEDWSE